MRWKLGLLFLSAATLFWTASFMFSPYTSWGVEHEQIRPGVPGTISGFALVASLLSLSAAAIVFWDAANRRGWRAIAFALPLLLVGGSAIARLVWIEFFVLA